MHAAAPGHQIIAFEARDGMDFVGQKALDAGGAGYKKVQLVHSRAPRIREAPRPGRAARPHRAGSHGNSR